MSSKNPKVESTGIVQDKNKVVAANEKNPNAPTKKEDSLTTSAKASDNKALKEDAVTQKQKQEEKAQKKEDARVLDKHVSSIKSELNPGGDVNILLTRDNINFSIPMNLETNKDRVSVDNAIKLVGEILNLNTAGEAKEKFAALIVS